MSVLWLIVLVLDVREAAVPPLSSSAMWMFVVNFSNSIDSRRLSSVSISDFSSTVLLLIWSWVKHKHELWDESTTMSKVKAVKSHNESSSYGTKINVMKMDVHEVRDLSFLPLFPPLTMSSYGVDVIGMFLRCMLLIVAYLSLYERDWADVRWWWSNGLLSKCSFWWIFVWIYEFFFGGDKKRDVWWLAGK